MWPGWMKLVMRLDFIHVMVGTSVVVKLGITLGIKVGTLVGKILGIEVCSCR